MSGAPMRMPGSGPWLDLLQHIWCFWYTAEFGSGWSTPDVVPPQVCALEHLEVELFTYQVFLDNYCNLVWFLLNFFFPK